jgi:molybdopterin molybdotransferase
MRGFQDRADVEDVQHLLDARMRAMPSEFVPLRDAAGRALAADVVAQHPVPGFNRAAMDGYALRGQDTFGAGPYNPLDLQVVGASFPGRPFKGRVGPGEAVKIMTGAPMPEGADAVLQAEAAEEISAPGKRIVRATDAVSPHRHVGRRGEDIEAGALVLERGGILRPQDVGVLASLGISNVSVVARPRVGIVVTGDELLPAGSAPEGYRIVDSNSVMLEALVRRDGGISETFPLVPDRRDSVRDAILRADTDVVLVSGGSSVGEEDHAPRVVAEIGELVVHGIALRPASPTGVGFFQGRPIFLLPGNPVSCLCAYDLFAGRAVRRLGGRALGLPYRARSLQLARKISSALGRVDYVRIAVAGDQVEPLAIGGASILSSTTRATGFVLVPRDSEGYAAGEIVTVYMYDEAGTVY